MMTAAFIVKTRGSYTPHRETKPKAPVYIELKDLSRRTNINKTVVARQIHDHTDTEINAESKKKS